MYRNICIIQNQFHDCINSIYLKMDNVCVKILTLTLCIENSGMIIKIFFIL